MIRYILIISITTTKGRNLSHLCYHANIFSYQAFPIKGQRNHIEYIYKEKRMKRILFVLTIALGCLSALAFASDMQDIELHPSCSYCGMNRDMFAQSRMLITYSDEHQFPACSLHCAALNYANQIDKTIEIIEVADFNSKKLIDAQSAVWVIGGSTKGVMTARPKWAFADETSAKAFIAANGGERADFDAAMNAAFEDMYYDTMMIRKKRAAMRMKMQDKNHTHQ